MKRKHPPRSLPFTSLSEIYRDSEPPSKKPRVDTPQYTRSDRRTRQLPKIEPPSTWSRRSSRSPSPKVNTRDPIDGYTHDPSDVDTQDPIETAWWDASITESSASSNDIASVKHATTRSMKRPIKGSTKGTSTQKPSRISRDSLTDEDMIDDHDPKMSEDYVPFSPPPPGHAISGTGKSARKSKDKSKIGRLAPGISPMQSMIEMIAAGDYIPFSPDSPVPARQQRKFRPPRPRSSLPVPEVQITRTKGYDPSIIYGADDPSPTVAFKKKSISEAEEEGAATSPSSIPPQVELDCTTWNPDLLKAQDGHGDLKRIWPARRGGVYCETCFRDECIRWIRARDKALRVSRVLGGDEDGSLTKPVIFPDQINHRVDKLFHRTPPDVVGLALLRILAQGRLEAFGEKSQDEVTEALDSLRQDVFASKGQVKRVERQCRALIETCGFSDPGRKETSPKDVAWLWEFDTLLQNTQSRFPTKTSPHVFFETSLATQDREAAIAELWTRAMATRGSTGGTPDKIDVPPSPRVNGTEFVTSVGTAMAQASKRSEKERDAGGIPFPCQYCAESESVKATAARTSRGRVVEDNPWIKSLIWSSGVSVEAASNTKAEDFFRLVEERGATMAEVSGIKFLVDSTGGEKRVVLVQMESVFDTMWKERQPGKRTSYETPVAVWEKWHDGGLQDYSIV
ncbi:hypothetical protein QBC41DRAFT_280504 [Cercophora samala]|uniref:Uncharacterized protein n=1 Tax=Cercophora samala TaxID=330535 RepID=A0AA40DAP7_9PEZI|nr:hypothetical protein QBC41DRAFT_280504 [Cercophora samala]